MKYKAYGIISICLAFVIIASSLWFARGDKTERYHQHLMAEPKTACSHSDGIFCTHLPLIQIDTDGVEFAGQSCVGADYRRVGLSEAQSS